MVEAVILDWDGTLWNVLDFMVETYTQVFESLGLRPWEKSEYREKFRHDWRGMLEDMGLEDHEDLLIESWDKKLAAGRPLAYPWAKGFEETLAKKYRLAVVSSAPRKPLLRELERNEILDSMEVVVSGEDLPVTKPSPTPLLHAVKKMGLKPGEAVYVGDMVEDIQACRRAKMPVVAVSWGLHSRDKLLSQKPDFLADTPGEVLEFIGGLP